MRTADAKKIAESGDQGADQKRVRPETSERVLDYFRRNATAMDSVEGIARFWVHEDRAVVEACLEDLHAQGLLDRRLIAGTAFYTLHRDPVAPEASAPQSHDGREMPQIGTHGRLLVVDDDASVRHFLVTALVEAGHSVAEAENGERAIEMVRERSCDVVLTDVMMPGTSGMEVLRTIKHLAPETEVIVVTAFATLDTALRALRDGAYDLVTKPLSDIDALYRVVDRALERRRLSLENRLLVDNLQARNIEMNDAVARLAAVNEIGRATTGLLELEALYNTLVRLVAQHLKARRVSVLVSEPDSEVMFLMASVGINDEDIRATRIRIGEGIAGRVAATQTPLLVEDIDKTDLKRLKGIGKYSTASFMISPLMVSYPIRFQRKQIGVINVSDKRSGESFNEQDLEFLSTLSAQVAVAIENARLVKEMEDGYLGALVELIRAGEDSRPETRGHSVRLATVAGAVAGELKVPQPRVDTLLRAVALHEVGRLTLGGATTAIAGANPEGTGVGEWTSDCVMAAERILAPIASLRSAREIILHSADRFDAIRLPFGVERSSIPIESRILSVCKDFTRLTHAEGADGAAALRALDALCAEAGRKHDPNVVEALRCVIEKRGR